MTSEKCPYCENGNLPSGVTCGICDGKGNFVRPNANAFQSARTVVDIEAAVADQFPNLRELNPPVFWRYFEAAVQLYAAYLTADALREAPHMREG
jgi:hypothetical protein